MLAFSSTLQVWEVQKAVKRAGELPFCCFELHADWIIANIYLSTSSPSTILFTLSIYGTFQRFWQLFHGSTERTSCTRTHLGDFVSLRSPSIEIAFSESYLPPPQVLHDYLCKVLGV